ncbi:MAG TPA: CDP-diacylglycerol O-phosphatidyltransferase [Flavobacteriales bacterium]|nr:CDP-diacylglycerol O-phosphatidyltransferase [Flavobacteriales bacterium]
MAIKKHIPNTLTSLNILCGCISLVFASNGQIDWAVYLIFIAVLFDFLDGLAARSLSAQSEFGKQLDSLADMVSFGVAPGFLAYNLMISITEIRPLLSFSPFLPEDIQSYVEMSFMDDLFPFVAFVIPIFTALRLAKFNIDSTQSVEFKGLASPGNALFIAGSSLYIQPKIEGMTKTLLRLGADGNSMDPGIVTIFLIGAGLTVVIVSSMMLFSVRMFSFKFSNLSWRENVVRYLFLLICLTVISFALLFKNLFAALPIIILLYIGLSMINNLFRKKDEV